MAACGVADFCLKVLPIALVFGNSGKDRFFNNRFGAFDKFFGILNVNKTAGKDIRSGKNFSFVAEGYRNDHKSVFTKVFSVGDVGNVVLRDRKILSEDGLVIVVATVDTHGSYVVSGPDIISRGFVYVKESEELLERARQVAEATLNKVVSRKYEDRMQIKGVIRDELAKFIFKETKRRPMILPIIMEV